VLRENAHRLRAILDGADYTHWNPALDWLFRRVTTANDFGANKSAGRRSSNTESRPAPTGPVVGMITRVVKEKGFEILVPLLDRLLWTMSV